CKSCGFVTIWPRPNNTDYKIINQLWYPTKFSNDPPEDKSEIKKFHKWKTMWSRISTYYESKSNFSLLDIGAGQGWATEYLQTLFPNIYSVSIEQWKPSQDYIKNKLGTKVIDIDITDDWPKSLHGKFDLIILRHTLEHLIDPLKTLKQIQNCLSNDGAAYIVVPNINIPPNKRLRTHFFRPVHLHYFSKQSFLHLTSQANLKPVLFNSDGEIWGLFTKGTSKVKLKNEYTMQKKHIADWQKKVFLKDFFQIIKIKLRTKIPYIYFALKAISKK
ncbi:class I SAM-dependent methyltransferase, partial [Alphaproteobacteria bacterium]|nr:class I SAM-dependent methyltransferase [Alphaproteobacteria bacterium]